jgi:hypothetical protein
MNYRSKHRQTLSPNHRGVQALKATIERESSLHVMKTTYSGLQEHRFIDCPATGQKRKSKECMLCDATPRSMGLLEVARANTAVGVSPKTFLQLLLQE